MSWQDGPVEGADLRVLSLGAGVQSSTLALMAAYGEVGPMPDAAIFADTGAEPLAVYGWLWWLAEQLPFPVHIVSRSNLRDDVLRGRSHVQKTMRERFVSIPVFTESASGGGMLRRQCTYEYKIHPVKLEIRRLLGLRPGQRAAGKFTVEQWIGISMDEVQRMKPAPDSWIKNRWPVIEKRMTRAHCIEWMSAKGFPRPPRSACTFCPFHSDAEWRRMRDEDPVSWEDAVRVDKSIRVGLGKLKERVYLHRSMVPLDEVDLSTAEERGQLNMFNNECEGMCGV